MTPDDTADALPGMELPTDGRTPGALVAAVRRTVAALNAGGHLGESHAAKLALALELAHVIEHKRATGKASTIGMDARVLLELLDSLVPATADDDTGLASAMAAWSAELGTP